VFYIDYGSIEIISRAKIRLLERSFGLLPVQAIFCSLYENDNRIRFDREINEKFAMMIDNKTLEAHFHKPKIEVIEKLI
jgi:hypothetical protein